MSIPKLELAVEPFESGKVVFLPMAPRSVTEKLRGRVVLRLSITNRESKTITVQSVTISFPGTSQPRESKPINQQLKSNDTSLWWFQEFVHDILFDLPGPDKIQIGLQVSGFTEQKIFTYTLAAHTSPVSGGAYLFPAKATDLEFGEFWSVNGCTHALGAEGSQSFGYDMGVMGLDPETGLFSNNIPGTDGSANIHKRIFGKPIYAMADGVVLHFLNDCPNNLWPLPWSDDEAEREKLANEQRINNWEKFNNPVDFGGAGNHFYIQHNEEVMLYAHMQKGTLNPALLKKPSLLKKGASVKAGELLGLAGNSGASSGPHTHIHAIRGTNPEVGPLRPIILKETWMIDSSLITNQPQKGTWTKANKTGISEGSTFINEKRDSFVSPSVKQPDYPEIVKHFVPESAYPALVNEFFSKGFRPVWFHAYIFASQTFFNVIFRPASELLWQSRQGLDKNEYQAEYNLWVKEKQHRIAHVCNYWSGIKKKIVYAVLFEKTDGPLQRAYHNKTQDEHKEIFDQWTSPQEGYIPTQISVVSIAGIRSYTGVYEKKNIEGGWELKTMLSDTEYQQKWNEHAKATVKKGLVWLHTYLHNGQPNFVGLWYAGSIPKGNHHLTPNAFESELIVARKNRLYLRGLCGYTRQLIPTYAAFWNR
jgi:murein DD-endopeptidase MepM/ murein hydrolase activator NlpD